MNISGFWLFENQPLARVQAILHEPANLIQVIPDLHHLIKMGPEEYRFVLQPAVAVWNVRELVVAVSLENPGAGPDLWFGYDCLADGERMLSGKGKINLTDTPKGIQMMYEMEGERAGALAEISDAFLETQVRSGFRRLCEAIERLLRGEVVRQNPAAAANTAREIWFILAGVMALLLLYLISRRSQD